MEQKTKDNIVKTLNVVLPICIAIIAINSYFIFFVNEDNFCVRAEGTVDLEDLEKKCFRSYFDANNYSQYLLEKYQSRQDNVTLTLPEYNFTLIAD